MKYNSKALRVRQTVTIIAILMLVIGCAVYMITMGRTNHASFGVAKVDHVPDSITAELNKEGVIEVVSATENSEDNDFIWIDVVTKSVGMGDVEMTVKWKSKNTDPDSLGEITDQELHYDFQVSPLGIIFNPDQDSFNGIEAVYVLMIGVLLITAVSLIISIWERQHAGDFTYSMVARCGVVIFNLVSSVIILINWLSWYDPYAQLDFRIIINTLLTTAGSFAGLTIIPLGILAIALAVSNIQLVRHEGFRVQNLLGFFLGVALMAGIITMWWLDHHIDFTTLTSFHLTMLVSIAFAFVYCYFECMLVSTIFCAVMCTRYKPPYDLDYIVILGCAIRSDGTPTPLLRGRADRALSFSKEQLEANGKALKFVPSGGQGSDEVISEAQSMADYLVSQGASADRILKEDKSVNTYQNMAFSKKIIEGDVDNIDDVNIGFATTNYHVFRGYTLANKLNMRVKGLSAKTKLYFFPNAFLREFIGLVWEQKVRHGIFIVSLLAFLALIYYVVDVL